jgi:hypothetical protein
VLLVLCAVTAVHASAVLSSASVHVVAGTVVSERTRRARWAPPPSLEHTLITHIMEHKTDAGHWLNVLAIACVGVGVLDGYLVYWRGALDALQGAGTSL